MSGRAEPRVRRAGGSGGLPAASQCADAVSTETALPSGERGRCRRVVAVRAAGGRVGGEGCPGSGGWFVLGVPWDGSVHPVKGRSVGMLRDGM